MAKEKQRVEAVERQLLRDIQKLTSRQFVYEDLWCGMVPFDANLTELQTGPPVPFADLTWREQADILREFIHWDHYPERAWNDDYTIRENIEAALPPEAWLKGTSLAQSFQHLADGKVPPPVEREPELGWEDLSKLLFSPDNPEAAKGPDQTPTSGTVHFQGFECEVEWTTYADGRPALTLVDTKGREMVAVATVNLPDAPQRPGEVFIKDYSENHGILAALEKAGIVKATGETVQSGFATVPVAKVLQPAITVPATENPGHQDTSMPTLKDQLFGDTLPSSSPEPPPQPEHSQNHRHKI